MYWSDKLDSKHERQGCDEGEIFSRQAQQKTGLKSQGSDCQ
jgi:hypothetical protein